MTRIERTSPDATRPFLQLLPIVELLRAHGNHTVNGGFVPTQGGWECHFAAPLDLDLIETQMTLPASITLSRKEGSVFDRLSWSVIQGPPPSPGAAVAHWVVRTSVLEDS